MDTEADALQMQPSVSFAKKAGLLMARLSDLTEKEECTCGWQDYCLTWWYASVF